MTSEVCRNCDLPIMKNRFTNRWESDDGFLYTCNPDQDFRERFHQPKADMGPDIVPTASPTQQERIASGACASYRERFGRREVPGVSENPEREGMPFL